MIKHAITLIGLCISTHAWALHTANITTVSHPDETNTCECHTTINDLGHAGVIWTFENDEEEEIVQVSMKKPGTKWSVRENISNWGSCIDSPSILIDQGGVASCCWETEEKSGTGYQYTRKYLDSDWETPSFSIAPDNSYYFEQSLHQDGTIFLVRHCYNKINIATFEPQKEPQFLVISCHRAQEASAAIPFGDSSIVAWIEKEDIQHQNLRIVCFENSKWSSPKSVQPLFPKAPGEYFFCWSVDGAFGVNQEGAFVMEIHGDTTHDVYVTTHCQGLWSPIEPLNQEGQAEDPVICSDREENVFIAYNLTLNNQSLLGMAFKRAGQQDFVALEPLKIEGKNNKYLVQPDNQGHFIIAWDSIYRKQAKVHGMQFSIETETFSKPALLSPKGKNCFDPSLCFNINGEGIIAWHQVPELFEINVQVADLIVD
ncbi:hypothetical protein [Simkania sp.]|uniref:hypothetical protein n=1 Tax=Simkania sp. TaxID=34094 RepID=UPI003B5180C3